MYKFGHGSTIATLEELEDRLKIDINVDYGNVALPYLEKYKSKIRLAKFNGGVVTIEILDKSCKESVVADLIEITRIQCKIKKKTYEDGSACLRLKFAVTPYKKCIKKLKELGFDSNKSKTKWNSSCICEKDVDKVLEELSTFKYLNIIREEGRGASNYEDCK